MLKAANIFFKKFFFIASILFSNIILADNFNYNIYNNHGILGLINQPTARFYDESVHGITVYDGTPDQKITLTSNPFDWMEASFFYTSIQGRPYCEDLTEEFCRQDYKDKGFNVKLKLKEEGLLPAIAIGFNDFAGTGLYGAEYIVGSYGINKIDMHFGIGWGALNGSEQSFKNPLSYISENFNDRPSQYSDKGGQLEPSQYFSGKTASPFYGISYVLNNKTLLKFESDTTRIEELGIKYEDRSSDYSIGVDYKINDNLNLGLSFERGNYFSLKFIYKNNPKISYKRYEYKKAEVEQNDNQYTRLIKNLEENGIGVNKIRESASSIGLELTQFVHPNIRAIEEIIAQSSKDAGINKNIKKDIKIADLSAYKEIENSFEKNSKLIYERKRAQSFSSKTSIKFRPFLAAREEFFKGSLLLENNSEYIIKDNIFFHANLKYSLADNFDDLRYPPVDTYPEQVRSDVKKYLNNIDEGILIGRAQIDYHLTLTDNHHLMITGGILEDMFVGFGGEYLFFQSGKNYAFGAELFKVKKRDYNWGFGTFDYENVTGSLNYYYRNYGLIPFDLKLSFGEYLAGDIGTTMELSRTYSNGVRFGAFASFTDVTAEQFGEGSFDKGIFFNIPIYGNLIGYTWRPLTKDPGAKLIRRNTLYDLLVKFRPIN